MPKSNLSRLRKQVAVSLLLTLVSANAIALDEQKSPERTLDAPTHKPTDNWLLLPVIAGTFAIFAVAPPVLLFFPLNPGEEKSYFRNNHALLFGRMGGGGTTSGNQDLLWIHQEGIQFKSQWFYSDLLSENFGNQTRLATQTIRAGYLFQSHSNIDTGLLLGYRNVTTGELGNAMEIGLPFVFGNSLGQLRLEPSYSISGNGVRWHYRLNCAFYVNENKNQVDLDISYRKLTLNDPNYILFALGFGVRL